MRLFVQERFSRFEDDSIPFAVLVRLFLRNKIIVRFPNNIFPAGIQQAADDMNVNVTVLGPDEFDLEKVAQLIDQAVAAQPDGIALTVTDADLFREPIQRALDAGIPVVGSPNPRPAQSPPYCRHP